MTETQLRQKVVDYMKSILGAEQGSQTQRDLVAYYNKLAGTSFNYNIAWCMITCQNAWRRNGVKPPITASCGQMISMCKQRNNGSWIENDAYVPTPGDACIFVWSDGANWATTDANGDQDHVEMVVAVDKYNGTFTTIGGNSGSPSRVRERHMAINGRYIRGFVNMTPYYKEVATEEDKVEKPQTATATTNPSKTASKYAKLSIDGDWGKKTTRRLQEYLGTEEDGIISNQKKTHQKYVPNASEASWEFKTLPLSGSSVIKALQKFLKKDGVYTGSTNGWCGKKTVAGLQEYLKKHGFYTGSVDSSMGPKTVKAVQTWLNK